MLRNPTLLCGFTADERDAEARRKAIAEREAQRAQELAQRRAVLDGPPIL